MNKQQDHSIDLNRLSTYRNEIYGVSILWIMLFHGYLVEVVYFKDVPILRHFGNALTYGNIGVEIFLFLSGISLYFSFKKNNDPVRFMKKRVLRLFPPLLLIYGIYCLFQYIEGKMTLVDGLFSLTTLRFWFTTAPANWFISLIFVCYLFYPYIYGIIYKDKEGILRRTIIMLVIVVAIIWMIEIEAQEIYSNIEVALTRFPVFIIGCSCGKAVYEKKKLPAWVWLIFAFAIIICFYVMEHKMIHGMWKRYWFMLGGIPLTFVIAYVVPLLGPVICRLFRFLGNISLELYISHLVMKNIYEQGYLFTYIPGSTIRWLVVLIISIAIAYLASRVESLIGKLVNRAPKQPGT